MMTNRELADKARMISNLKTTYMLGGFGHVANQNNIDQLCKQYQWNETVKQNAVALKGDGFIFDCVCLIKAILWGFTGDKTKSRGGAIYEANGVPDLNANSFFAKCTNPTSDFSKIEIGEAVWLDGHIGIYIGNDTAVEATAKWSSKVLVSYVANRLTKEGYACREWTKHGLMPWVSYSTSTASNSSSSSRAPSPSASDVDYKKKYTDLKTKILDVVNTY